MNLIDKTPGTQSADSLCCYSDAHADISLWLKEYLRYGFLVVQWLGLQLTARGMNSISGWGTRDPVPHNMVKINKCFKMFKKKSEIEVEIVTISRNENL